MGCRKNGLIDLSRVEQIDHESELIVDSDVEVALLDSEPCLVERHDALSDKVRSQCLVGKAFVSNDGGANIVKESSEVESVVLSEVDLVVVCFERAYR